MAIYLTSINDIIKYDAGYCIQMPIHCANRMDIIGVEFLFRIKNGFVFSANGCDVYIDNNNSIEFIFKHACHSGESVATDIYILRKICEQVYNSGVKNGTFISVNLSFDSIIEREVQIMLSSLASELSTYSSVLQIEFVEHSISCSVNDIIDATMKIKENCTGHVIYALDDYGEGVNTSIMLRKLSSIIERVKISKNIFLHSNFKEKICRVKNEAHSLGIKHIIVEGVDSIEKLISIRELRISSFQGFLYRHHDVPL